MKAGALRFLFRLVAIVLLLLGYVQAAELKANCDGNGPRSSITKVLAKLPPGPNRITVTGTCRENVLIQGIDDLTLVAAPGVSIVDPSLGVLSAVQIEHSRRVTISGFEIVGGLNGVACVRASDCTVSNNNFHGSVLSEVFVFESSSAILSGNHVHDAGLGITAAYSSFLHLLGGTLGDANIIENIYGNGTAVQVYGSSSARVEGTPENPNIIRNNPQGGVSATYSEATLFNTVLTGNGSVSNLNSAAVTLVHSGARLIAPVITDNLGPGLLLANASNAGVGGANIARNGRNGVVVLLQSSVNFGSPANSVTGNARSDVFCDSTAVLQNPAMLSGGGVVNCPNMVVNFGPVP